MSDFKRKKDKAEKKAEKEQRKLEKKQAKLNKKEEKRRLKEEKKRNKNNYNIEQEEFIDENQEVLEDQEELVDNPEETQEPQIVYSQEELVSKNLIQDALYTKHDLENLGLNDDDVIKFFKNGSVYYKLKTPLESQNLYSKEIFKKNTMFALREIKEEYRKKDLIFGDIGYPSAFDFDESYVGKKDGVNQELKDKIYELNNRLQFQIDNIESYVISDKDIDKIAEAQREIMKTQKEIKRSIFNLKDDYANSNISFKVHHLDFNSWNEDEIYFGYRLNNVSFDIFQEDRVAIVSDDSVSNQLLIDILRGDEQKTGGYVYKNFKSYQRWIDVDSDLYDKYQNNSSGHDIFYDLKNIDYISFKTNKNTKVMEVINKVLENMGVELDHDFLNHITSLMQFSDALESNLVDLDDISREKLTTLLDILVGKRMILIKSIFQGMNSSDRIKLFEFLEDYFKLNKTTVLYASDDYNEADLFATKVLIIKSGFLIEVKNKDQILSCFNTVNEFIIKTLKNAKVPEYALYRHHSPIVEENNYEEEYEQEAYEQDEYVEQEDVNYEDVGYYDENTIDNNYEVEE